MEFFIVLFFIFVGGGWLLGKGIGNLLFPENKEKYTFHTTEVHNHYHDHKHISIIDEQTKKAVFNLKKLEENKKPPK